MYASGFYGQCVARIVYSNRISNSNLRTALGNTYTLGSTAVAVSLDGLTGKYRNLPYLIALISILIQDLALAPDMIEFPALVEVAPHAYRIMDDTLKVITLTLLTYIYSILGINNHDILKMIGKHQLVRTPVDNRCILTLIAD